MDEGVHLVDAVLNATRVYSPVTMSSDWPTLARLLFVVFCASLGTTINGFFVSAFFVEPPLKRPGNVFLACVGLADMILTTIVMPICSVVLLSGQWDNLPVCKSLQFFSETSTYSFSMFFALVSIETYYRLCRPSAEYQMFIAMRIGCIAVLVFIISFSLSGVGVYLDLDYDYCRRSHYGDFYFRSATSVIFHGIPFIVTFWGLLSASVRIRLRAQTEVHYRRSQQFERDYSTTNLNITAYIIFVLSWSPYLIVVHEFPNTSDSKFYHSVWIGVFRTIFNGLLYSCMNRNFRHAFAHLFYYCCCKSNLNGSYSSRHRRALEYKTATGDVRVHIMHQAVLVHSHSPSRNAASTRETQDL